MPQELVSPEEFLSRLEKSFTDPSSSQSIWLTHKRYTYDGEDEKMVADEGDEEEFDVLIRCVHGDQTKFSARIPATSLPTFHQTYGTLLKSSMAPKMRKRDKKKEKLKLEQFNAKRRELGVDVVIGQEGKRGKGRRQRSRKIAAQKKKEAERERIELTSKA